MKSRRNHHIGFTVLALFAWQIIAYVEVFPVTLFPKLEVIAIRWLEMITKEQLVQKVFYSCVLVIVSMFISMLAMTLLVIVAKWVKLIKHGAEWLSAIASPLPGIAILPLVILWLGISHAAMLFVLVHAMFWPLWNSVDLAVDRIEHQYKRFMKVYQVSFINRFYHIYLLGIVRDLYSGLNIAWSRGWRALISVEMIFGMVGEHGGLGWLIYERRMYMDTPGLYASIFTIAGIGIFVEQFLFKRGGRYA